RLLPYIQVRPPERDEPSVYVNEDGELKPTSPIISYDIGKALKDGVVSDEELIGAGYTEEELQKAKKYTEVGAKQYIPIYGTVALWEVMTPAEKALTIGLEALWLVPVIGWYGKVGQLGLKAIAAEATTLRNAADAALKAGNLAGAIELNTRATKLLRPALSYRLGNVGKSLLYGTEEVITSPPRLIYKAIRGSDRMQLLKGLGEITIDPFRHPIETLKGLGFVVSGKVPLGESLILHAGKIISPARVYPEAAFTELTATGVPRAPLTAGRAASLEGARGAIIQSAKGEEVIRVALPNGQVFEVPITPYQKVFGPKFIHATPTVEAYRGLGIEIKEGGQFASPWLSRQWTYATAGGVPGVSHG
ncbi:hypothetical protein LCGC14_3014870, partial [marine sediment metagenome]